MLTHLCGLRHRGARMTWPSKGKGHGSTTFSSISNNTCRFLKENDQSTGLPSALFMEEEKKEARTAGPELQKDRARKAKDVCSNVTQRRKAREKEDGTTPFLRDNSAEKSSCARKTGIQNVIDGPSSKQIFAERSMPDGQRLFIRSSAKIRSIWQSSTTKARQRKNRLEEGKAKMLVV